MAPDVMMVVVVAVVEEECMLLMVGSMLCAMEGEGAPVPEKLVTVTKTLKVRWR